jgi:hypothetical protein
MGRAVAAPSTILKRKPGVMELQTCNGHVGIFVKMTSWAAGDLPRFCDVDVRLAAWEIGQVMAIACMVRLAKDTIHTYQTWVDPGNAQGIHLLKNLSKKNDLVVYIVTDKVERQIPTYNVVYRQTLDFLRVLSRRAHAWDTARFDLVRSRADRLYPSMGDLWRACTAGELRSL